MIPINGDILLIVLDFNSKGEFIRPDGGDSKNVIIIGADLSNSRHANNSQTRVYIKK